MLGGQLSLESHFRLINIGLFKEKYKHYNHQKIWS